MDYRPLLVIGTDSEGYEGLDITDLITNYHVGYYKLWSSDTGRNMQGSNKGTLIGIFTKLQISTGQNKMTEERAMALLSKLNTASVYCKYYDIATDEMKVESFYFGDVENDLLRTGNIRFKEFSIIANERRS